MPNFDACFVIIQNKLLKNSRVVDHLRHQDSDVASLRFNATWVNQTDKQEQGAGDTDSWIDHSKHIEVETKWLPPSTRHFQAHFLEWKRRNVNSNFTEICSLWSN